VLNDFPSFRHPPHEYLCRDDYHASLCANVNEITLDRKNPRTEGRREGGVPLLTSFDCHLLARLRHKATREFPLRHAGRLPIDHHSSVAPMPR
jgi:hypothetical protein